MVMHGDIFLDGAGKFGEAAEYTAAQAFCGDVAEKPFNHIEPRGRGRGEMHMEARMFRNPPPDRGMLMGMAPCWPAPFAPDGITIVAGDALGRMHILRLDNA